MPEIKNDIFTTYKKGLGMGAKPKSKPRVTLNKGLTVSENEYKLLLNYILARIDTSEYYRDELCYRFEQIDYDYFAIDKNLKDDKHKDNHRRNKNKRGQHLREKFPDIKLNFVADKIADTVTSITQMLIPIDQPYHVVATPEEAPKANALTKVLKEEAVYFKHFSEYTKIVTNALTYNLTGQITEWVDISGFGPVADQDTKQVNFENNILFSGNRITAIDPYNTYWDTFVDIEKVSTEGEFIATVHRQSLFKLRKQLQDNKLYGPKELKTALENLPKHFAGIYDEMRSSNKAFNTREDLTSLLSHENTYISDFSQRKRYYDKPRYDPCAFNPDSSRGPVQGASEILSDIGYGDISKNSYGLGSYENLKVFMKLNPKELNLSEDDETQTWYFEIVNDTFIVFASVMPEMQGRLPCSLGTLSLRDTKTVDKSTAESLMPFQHIASGLFNQHMQANRRSINGGNTFYDANAVDIDKMQDASISQIPVDMEMHDTPDIRKHIAQFSDIPNNSRGMQDVQSIYDIVDNSLPSNAAKRIGDLQRATEYQAQTAYFESNKRIGLFARLLDNRVLSDTRLIMFYNELQNRDEFTGVDDKGQEVKYSPSDMISVKTTFSNGLRSIDKFSVMAMYEKILNFVVQGRLAEQGVDLLGIVDHFATLGGDETDLSRFRLAHPIDGFSTEQKNQALQVYQQVLAAQEQGTGASNVQ